MCNDCIPFSPPSVTHPLLHATIVARRPWKAIVSYAQLWFSSPSLCDRKMPNAPSPQKCKVTVRDTINVAKDQRFGECNTMVADIAEETGNTSSKKGMSDTGVVNSDWCNERKKGIKIERIQKFNFYSNIK
ncbi:hypothetical protein SESBI_31780 [Sesbania bispinosa]|nr:hypothetical protein SESBI_31780 [Sesbania bispinosa]